MYTAVIYCTSGTAAHVYTAVIYCTSGTVAHVYTAVIYCTSGNAAHVYTAAILGAFAKLRKATSSFVMSVRPHGTTRSPLDGFSLNFILEDFFRKFVAKIQVS